MERINRPRGTADVLPEQARVWRQIEETARRVCGHFHVQEIRTPMFEHTELFLRGVGDGTDIVEKEMYTFEDKGGRRLTLRPEGTAGVARAVLENRLYAESLPQKYFYIGPMFRYERPGQGRYRQHHQFGIELIGTESAAADVEVMATAMRFYEELGITGLTLVVNSVGCADCRQAYRQRLLDYVQPRLANMCEDCQRRSAINPLRILDCKQERCHAELASVPSIQECLCGGCQAHFKQLTDSLAILGLPYEVDPSLVRGLDYYTRTVFEIMYGEAGNRSTVAGGGRYNGLLSQLGGPDLPGIGFGCGLERAIWLMEQCGIDIHADDDNLDVFLIPIGDQAQIASLPVLATLRREGLAVERDFTGSVKNGLKKAAKLGAKYAVLIGDEEIQQGKVQVKVMATGQQSMMSVEELLYEIER